MKTFDNGDLIITTQSLVLGVRGRSVYHKPGLLGIVIDTYTSYYVEKVRLVFGDHDDFFWIEVEKVRRIS